MLLSAQSACCGATSRVMYVHKGFRCCGSSRTCLKHLQRDYMLQMLFGLSFKSHNPHTLHLPLS